MSGTLSTKCGQKTRLSRCREQLAGDRLQKILASSGIASRRECERIIGAGRVEVNGQVVTQLGTRADVSCDEIRLDGELLRQPKRVYYMVHKPVGVVSTCRDPAGRLRVTDLVPADLGRCFQVGRLDLASEGLVLVTNDGELANRLTHPRYEVEKVYQVEVVGHPSAYILEQLRRGVHLAEGVAQVKRVRVKTRRNRSTVLEMVLDEGKNREIRRVLARFNHKVQRLRRVAVGPVRLGDLPPGAYRPLTQKEVRALLQTVRSGGRPDRPAGKGGR